MSNKILPTRLTPKLNLNKWQLMFKLLFVSLALSSCESEEPPAHVRDLAGILSPDAAADLDRQLQQYRSISGTHWYLHTQASLEVPTIDALSLKLNDELQLGREGLNNGGIIMLTQRERQVRIEVQDGLAWQIPDSVSAQIYDQIRPKLSAGAYAEAFRAGFAALQALAGSVSWEVAYESLDALTQADSQAVGQIVRFEGEALSLFNGAVRPNQQFSPAYRLEVVDGRGTSVLVFFTSHMFQWLDQTLVPGETQTIYGRILSLEPLAVALLGVEPPN